MAKRIILADDTKESTGLLIKLRIPVLVIGLILGLGASYFVSRFEEILSQNVALAFFIPLIVYMADAVGTQTETIYVRNLKNRNTKFAKYFIKELFVGTVIGIFFGLAVGISTLAWLRNFKLSLTIGLSMGVAIATAPIVALTIANILYRIHKDPAVGAGPFTTLIQDIISLIIYFLVASLILLS